VLEYLVKLPGQILPAVRLAEEMLPLLEPVVAA
jgi:hypothetical protein